MTKLHKFSVSGIPVVRRPVDDPPPDNTVCFVDNGGDSGWQWNSGAIFKGGEWTNARGRPLKNEPTHWTTIDDKRRDQ